MVKNISKKKFHQKTKISKVDQISLDSLNQNGYCVVKNVLKKKFIDELRLDFEKEIKKQTTRNQSILSMLSVS